MTEQHSPTAIDHAQDLAAAGDFASAADILREYLAATPDDAFAHRLRAIYLIEMNQPEEARTEVVEGLRLAPMHEFSYYTLALIRIREEDGQGAESAIREAIRLDPDIPRNWQFLAELFGQRSQWEAALDAADRGLSAQPGDSGCTIARLAALIRLNRCSEGFAEAQQLLKAQPDSTAVSEVVGWIQLGCNDYPAATECFDRILRLHPDHPGAQQGREASIAAAKSPLAPWMAPFALLQRLPGWVVGAVIFGGWLGSHALLRLARARPGLTPPIIDILAAVVLFFVLPIAYMAAFTLWSGKQTKDTPSPVKSLLSAISLTFVLFYASLMLLPFSLVSPAARVLSLLADFALTACAFSETNREDGKPKWDWTRIISTGMLWFGLVYLRGDEPHFTH